jgi:glyoxylase-like metal-dependent hydrolase (beta-lactamase superfamily II)
MKIGEAEVLPLSDGYLELGVAQLFPDATEAEWEPFRSLVTAEQHIQLQFGSFLVRAGGRLVLVDTGVGGRPGRRMGEMPMRYGELLTNLRGAGVQPDEVDYVVNTHLHFDHIGWNTVESKGDAVPTFSRARYVIQRQEWDYWSGLESAPRYVQECALPLQRAGRLHLVRGEQRLTPEITVWPTPGHTPGHQSIFVRSGGEGALITGDTFYTPAQVSHPEWQGSMDRDRERACSSRAAILERIEAEGLHMAAGHFYPDCFGRVIRIEARRYWQGATNRV